MRAPHPDEWTKAPRSLLGWRSSWARTFWPQFRADGFSGVGRFDTHRLATGGDQMICSECVTPPQLKAYIDGRGLLCVCKYCDTVNTAVEPAALFDHILGLVDKNVAKESDLSDYELDLIYELGSDEFDVQPLDIVLSEWFDLGYEPYFDALLAYAPRQYLTNEKGQDRHYFSNDDDSELNLYEVRWLAFIQAIRHSHRFFNSNAQGFLGSVFSLVSGENGELKPTAIRTIRKGEALYRARTAFDYKAATAIENSPHTELGPTPREKAGSQRMTPTGISALYCALDRATCLSEIRSITGDVVVSGALTPTSQLTLLDLTKLDQLEGPKLTYFDDGFRDSLHLRTFLKSLVKKMSKPKGRNDDLAYLSTQVVFEYLRLQFGKQVDGLVFPSVQTGETGTNVVLFPEASVVSSLRYFPPDELELAFTADPRMQNEAFGEGTKLAFIANSLRYHRVTAIETKADEYKRPGELFMSDLTRKRLGLPPV